MPSTKVVRTAISQGLGVIHGPERKDGGLRNASQTFAWAPCVAVVCRSLPSALCTSTERAPGRSRLQTLLITVSCPSGMGPGDLKTHVFTAGCLARACSKKREFYRHPPRTYSVQYATLREKKKRFQIVGCPQNDIQQFDSSAPYIHFSLPSPSDGWTSAAGRPPSFPTGRWSHARSSGSPSALTRGPS